MALIAFPLPRSALQTNIATLIKINLAGRGTIRYLLGLPEERTPWRTNRASSNGRKAAPHNKQIERCATFHVIPESGPTGSHPLPRPGYGF